MDKPGTGKTCLVTGGASGLGKAIATKYSEAGANVVICDINEERLRETRAELSNRDGGGGFMATKADITSADEVQRLFSEIAAEYPKLDVVVNNAGIMDRLDPVGDLDDNVWDKVMAVNLRAPFLVSKHAVRTMLAQESPGCILNIVSVAGKAGWSGGAAYTASKHGLVGLTKNTASFYGSKGIRCNALIMGGMDTNIVDAFKSNVNAEGMKKTHDLGAGVKVPLCDTNQAADVCVSLTFGGGAGLINGACIPVDHGWCGTWGIS